VFEIYFDNKQIIVDRYAVNSNKHCNISYTKIAYTVMSYRTVDENSIFSIFFCFIDVFFSVFRRRNNNIELYYNIVIFDGDGLA